jgi:hypothetical protein
MRDFEKLKELLKKGKIFHNFSYYSWGARHYNYSELTSLDAPSGSIVIILTHYPYGLGAQWDYRDYLVIVPTESPAPVGQVKSFNQDWALLERRPEGEKAECMVSLREISLNEALEIINDYLKYGPERVVLEIEYL